MKLKKTVIGALAGALALASAFGTTACGGDGSDAGVTPKEPVCEHVLTRVAHVDSTCTEQGHIAHYTCSKCDKLFFDEKATVELPEASIVIPTVKHSTEHYAATDKLAEHWHCIACDKYFTDAAFASEISRGKLYENYYNPIKCTDGQGNINMYHSTMAGGTLEPIAGDFTFRCFVSWKNADGKGYDTLTSSDKLMVFINLNDQTTITSSARWYNFGVGYNGASGLYYKKLESGDTETAPQYLNDLFLKQGGIYVVVVREGGTVSFYFEDESGVPRLMGTGMNYGKDSQMIRLAANQFEGTTGWTQSITESAICVGIADVKCVFDKAYAEA